MEVCLLEPTEHGEGALRLCTATASELFESFLRYAGPEAVTKFGGSKGPSWVEGPSPLDNPDLHDIMEPVLRDLLVLLVPLLLPECHDIPLPASEAAQPGGSKLSGLLPQQIMHAVAAGQRFLPGWSHRPLFHSILMCVLHAHLLHKSVCSVSSRAETARTDTHSLLVCTVGAHRVKWVRCIERTVLWSYDIMSYDHNITMIVKKDRMLVTCGLLAMADRPMPHPTLPAGYVCVCSRRVAPS